MVIVIVAVVLLILGIVIGCLHDWFGVTEEILCIVGGITLVLSLISIPICRMETYATIRSIEQVRTSIEIARENGREIELAALATKISEYNAEIEKMKYYHDTVFRIWWPDEVMNIKPLE